MTNYTTVDPFETVPQSTPDPLAQKAQEYIITHKNIPEHLGITIRVIKRSGRYYISEWRVGEQSFSGKPTRSPIARISRIKGKPDKWRLAWMRSNMKWHNLPGDEYQGTFDHCLKMIIADPDCCFWG